MSAEAFREAVEKFAEAIAQNRELSDENRQLVLESIDVAAEEATQPPEKRRLRAVGPLLTAIPGAISLSGDAIEALGCIWKSSAPSSACEVAGPHQLDLRQYLENMVTN